MTSHQGLSRADVKIYGSRSNFVSYRKMRTNCHICESN